MFIELFNQEFHIVIDLPRNGRWSQRHGADGGDADRWGVGEGGHDNGDGDGDGNGDDECQNGRFTTSLMCGFTRLD